MKELLGIFAGFALLVAFLLVLPETDVPPEILHGHSFQVENNGLYLANLPTKADGVTYYRTGWGPKVQARSYGEWIRAYEDVQEWGGHVVIQQYDPVTPDEKELP